MKKAEEAASQISLQKRLQNAKEICDKVRPLISLPTDDNIDAVWNLAEQGVAYAQYVLDTQRYYGGEFHIKKEKLNEIQRHVDKGFLFAQYLKNWYSLRDAFQHYNTLRPISPVIKESTEIIYALAQKGV